MSECPKMVWGVAMFLLLGLISSATAANIKTVEYGYKGEGCGCSNRLHYQNNVPIPMYALSSPSEYDYRSAEPMPKAALPHITSYRLDFVAEEPFKQKPESEDLYAKVDRITLYKDSQDGGTSANQISSPRPRVCGCEQLTPPSTKPLYRFVYKNMQPFSPQTGQYKPKTRYQFAVVSPVASLQSSDSKNPRRKREVHLSEFLQERKQKKTQRPEGRFSKVYHTKMPGKRQSLDRKDQASRRYQKPLNRQKPHKRQSTLSHHTPHKRQTAPKYQTSLNHQTPLRSKAPLRYQIPLKRESPLKHQAPPKRQASLKRQTSLKRQKPIKRQIPLKGLRLLKFQKPLKRTALKYQTKFLRQKPLKRQTPLKRLTPLKRRTPPKRQAPFKGFGEMLQAQVDRLKLQRPLLSPTIKRSRLVKRDIKAEYDLLQREREQLDLTLPEIIQFMPETLQPNFKRGQCNIGCASLKKSSHHSESSSVSEESQEAAEKDGIIENAAPEETNDQHSNNNAQRTETANNNKSKADDRFFFYLMPPSENAISNTADSRSISTAYQADTRHQANSAALSPIYALQMPSFNAKNDDRAQQRKQRHIHDSGATVQQAVRNDYGRQPIYGRNDLQHDERLRLMNNYAPVPAPWTSQLLVNSPPIQNAPLPSALGIPKEDLDKFIVDTLQRHPDFIEATSHYGGALVDPEHTQIAETKDLLQKLIAGRLHLWFGN